MDHDDTGELEFKSFISSSRLRHRLLSWARRWCHGPAYNMSLEGSSSDTKMNSVGIHCGGCSTLARLTRLMSTANDQRKRYHHQGGVAVKKASISSELTVCGRTGSCWSDNNMYVPVQAST